MIDMFEAGQENDINYVLKEYSGSYTQNGL